MLIVSSTLGWSTTMGWKRRSSAGSFSMCLRYSSRVVAPMQRSSPRASAGLSMLPASMAPSAAPAPGVELPPPGFVGEVAAVLLQRLVLGLGVGVGDPLRAANLLQRLVDAVAGDARLAQQAGRVTALLGGHGEEKVFCRHVLVVEPPHLVEGGHQPRAELGADGR